MTWDAAPRGLLSRFGVRTRRRIVASGLATPALGVLGVAAWLQPAAAGSGTHEQLGLPPCGWMHTMDMPCPTCGMTTAFTHAADGDLWSSLVTQPMGMVLALATAMVVVGGFWTAASGSAALPLLASRLWGRWTGWILAAMLIAAWVYKIGSHKGWFG